MSTTLCFSGCGCCGRDEADCSCVGCPGSVNDVLNRIFQEPDKLTPEEYSIAFRLVNKCIEYPNSIPLQGYYSKLQWVPNLLLFYASCLRADNYVAAKSYMISPLVWLNMMKFLHHNADMYGGNMSDYFDRVVMRAYHRGLIKEIPDEMVQAALTSRVNKIMRELEEFDRDDPVSQANKLRLLEMYQE